VNHSANTPRVPLVTSRTVWRFSKPPVKVSKRPDTGSTVRSLFSSRNDNPPPMGRWVGVNSALQCGGVRVTLEILPEITRLSLSRRVAVAVQVEYSGVVIMVAVGFIHMLIPVPGCREGGMRRE